MAELKSGSVVCLAAALTLLKAMVLLRIVFFFYLHCIHTNTKVIQAKATFFFPLTEL